MTIHLDILLGTLSKSYLEKKEESPIFIESEDRLKAWEEHFKTLLNSTNSLNNTSKIIKVFDLFDDIPTGTFTAEKVSTAIKQTKNGKSPGLDGLSPEFWKLPRMRKIILKYCNETYVGNRLPEWGVSAITPIPQKGDLRKTDNYRGISLTPVAAKIYNRCLLNRIRPVINPVLRPSQNGFRPGRPTTAQIFALRRIVEELKNHVKEVVIIFVDFKKAFDSIDREKMFEILTAYGIPTEVVQAIKVMYKNTSAQGRIQTYDKKCGEELSDQDLTRKPIERH